MTSQAALIFNPRAGTWRTASLVEEIRQTLAASGYDTEPLPTQQPGHATQLAREAAARGVEVVFAHGGDGTLREAAAGLVGSATALAPIPGGTTNVVALALGLPNHPLRAAAALAGAETFSMDVGSCGGEVFLMQTSAGIDAYTMGRLDPVLKRRLGKVAVGFSALSSLRTYGYPSIELVADGRPLEASFVAVCNLAYYAGTHRLAPAADPTDGVLDLVIFRGQGRWATIHFARDLLLGRHPRRPDVEMMQVREVEIRRPRDLAVQLDGDTLPVELPVTVGIHPQTIHMLKPLSA